MSAQLKFIRFYMRFLSAVSPSVAAKKAFDMFQKVRIKSIRNREKKFFDTAEHFEIPFDNEALSCYKMGNNNGDLVVLVHGWESNAGSMSKIGRVLAEQGKSVLLFNLPGHAFYQSESTNLLECKNAMQTVMEHIDPQKPFSVISHSFGSAVTSFFLAETSFQTDQLFYLTGPNRVENIFTQFKEFIHLGDKAYDKMIGITENILQKPVSEISIANNLKRSNFNHLNLIHDTEDKVIPFSNSEEVKSAIPEAELIPFKKIGHYRMLWNQDVIDLIAERLSTADHL